MQILSEEITDVHRTLSSIKRNFLMTIYGKLYHGHIVQQIIEYCLWNLKSNQYFGEQIQIRLSQILVHLLGCLIQSSQGLGNSDPIRCQSPICHIMHEFGWVDSEDFWSEKIFYLYSVSEISCRWNKLTCLWKSQRYQELLVSTVKVSILNRRILYILVNITVTLVCM